MGISRLHTAGSFAKQSAFVRVPTPLREHRMSETIKIRDSLANDFAAIESLYPDAFPDEDLLPVVNALLHEEAGVLSLVAVHYNDLIGHIAFTPCSVASTPVSLLAPLAVATAQHRQGIGSKLVRTGLQRLRESGTMHVFVLGDPNYYGRFGFDAEMQVAPPYPIPEEWRTAWQSLSLIDDAPPLSGTLSVPPAWRQRILWAP